MPGDSREEDVSEMSEEERKGFYEELGLDPARVRESEVEDADVSVIEEGEEVEEEKEEELEKYREEAGF